jgi:hypothetical protein
MLNYFLQGFLALLLRRGLWLYRKALITDLAQCDPITSSSFLLPHQFPYVTTIGAGFNARTSFGVINLTLASSW